MKAFIWIIGYKSEFVIFRWDIPSDKDPKPFNKLDYNRRRKNDGVL